MQLQYPDAPTGTRAAMANVAHYAPYIRSIVRIVVALLFFSHGLSKMIGFPQGPALPVDFSLHWFSGAIEFGGGILLTVGLFSRFAALIMSGEMAFAYFLSPCAAWLFSADQSRRGRHPLLLYFPLFRLRRAGPVEPRRADRAQTKLAAVPPVCTHRKSIRDVTPSALGCEECLEIGSPWVHLRLCRSCGHVGCCDDLPNRHARKHFHADRPPDH